MAKAKKSNGNFYLKVILYILFLPVCILWVLYKFTKKQLQEDPGKVWFKQMWGIILALIIFFPAGVYFLWRYGKFQKKGKSIMTACFGVLFLFSCSKISETNKEFRQAREYEQEMRSLQAETTEPTVPVTESTEEETISASEEATTTSNIKDTESNDVTENSETTEVRVSLQSNLTEFLLELVPETARDKIEELAQKHGLMIDHRNTGTGIYVYRIANSKNVVKSVKPENGSVVTVSFDALHDNILTEITYFDEERMIGGFWKSDNGYSMIDYNNPQIVADSSSSQITVSSFQDVVDYQPKVSDEDNLLEELFLNVSESMTKSDLINYAEEHNLAYTFRGKGNENLLAYSDDVIKKYGNANEGSYLEFHYDSNEIITHLAYYEYPYYYETGYSANYYSDSYSYSELAGYYLYAYKKDPIQYDDARSLIDEINKSRKISQPEAEESTIIEETSEPETEQPTTEEPTTEEIVTEPATEAPTQPPTVPPTEAATNPPPVTEPYVPPVVSHEYWINTDSGKFHSASCHTIKNQEDPHWQVYSGNREDLISLGYDPCGVCEP
ncbi:MAG: VanZ family protein [Oscillospiraceae bacterium]|nr:VanZ family protein [Oscillospiraceae bacterium]